MRDFPVVFVHQIAEQPQSSVEKSDGVLELRPPRTISESRCAGVRRVDSGRRDSGSRRTLVSRMA
jgi:hypothetical protein